MHGKRLVGSFSGERTHTSVCGTRERDMDIVAAITKLDTQFKRGLLSAADYSWELQLITSSKVEELANTYTIITMADGEVCGKSTQSLWTEVQELVTCYKCTEMVDKCVNCPTDEFLSELDASGKAVMVTRDAFGVSTVVAYKNED